MKCMRCGTKMKTRRENRRYDFGGLDNVTLLDVEVRHCPECGADAVVVQNTEELHRALAHAVATQPERLSPREVRFLRMYLGLSSSDFARRMGVSPETVSRWERVQTPVPMAPPAERLLRLMVLVEKPVNEYPLDQLEEVGKGEPVASWLKVKATGRHWKAERQLRAA